MTSPDRELLTQAAARQLLERAGEIDLDSHSVDTLRAAAQEAGISAAAFDAALAEMRGKVAKQQAPAHPRSRSRLIVAAVAVVAIVALFVFPRSRGGVSKTDVVSYEMQVKCLSMREAQGLAQRLLLNPAYPENEVQLSAGSRTLRVRATQPQIEELQRAFDAAARQRGSCDNSPAR